MREGSYGGLIKLTNNNVIELTLPATTSSVVASSSAKGPPKQYPNKFNVSQMARQFCLVFTDPEILTNCTVLRICAYIKDKSK